MLNAAQIVLALLIMMSVGYFFSKKKRLNEDVATFLSRLVLWIGVPSAALSNMLSYFDRGMIKSAGIGILVPFLGMLLSFAVGFLVSRLLKVKRGRRGIFCLMFSLSNTIFIGLPVCQALFGEEATPYALFYYMSNTFVAWTLGIYIMQRDSEALSGVSHTKIFSVGTLKKIFSPGLVSFVLSLILIMLDVKLPLFMTKTFKYLGSVCTPLALIFIGHMIQRIGLKNLRFQKDTLGVLLGKVLVAPLLVFFITKLVGSPAEMSRVLVTQAAMPIMANAPILAKAYGSDSTFAAEGMALSTLLNIALLPLLMLLLQYVF